VPGVQLSRSVRDYCEPILCHGIKGIQSSPLQKTDIGESRFVETERYALWVKPLVDQDRSVVRPPIDVELNPMVAR